MTQPNTLHTLPVSTVEPPLSVSRKEDRQDGTMARLLREVKSLRAAIGLGFICEIVTFSHKGVDCKHRLPLFSG